MASNPEKKSSNKKPKGAWRRLHVAIVSQANLSRTTSPTSPAPSYPPLYLLYTLPLPSQQN